MIEYTHPTIRLERLCLVFEHIWQEMASYQHRYRHWPASPDKLCQYLQQYYPRIPVIVHTEKQGKYAGRENLLLCTSLFCLKVASSRDGDAYIVLRMQPLGHREHDTLARGEAVPLAVGAWQAVLEHAQISRVNPRRQGNRYAEIVRAWHQIQQSRQQRLSQQRTLPAEVATITPAQEQWLHTVERAIQITQEVEQVQEKLRQPIFYRSVEPVGVARYTRHDIYRFQRVEGGASVERGLFLSLAEHPDLRGHVIEVTEESFTVHFERAVDLEELEASQSFRPCSNQAAFRVQREAVEALRDGRAENPFLLSILTAHRYQAYQQHVLPRLNGLNEAQQQALERALSVKDLLLIQGPPGTGKTHTISEIARQCASRHQRVLVTARTHRAVDNVLSNLPQGLTVLRVGQESLVAPEIRRLVIDARASSLQQSVLQASEAPRVSLERAVALLPRLDDYVQRLPSLRETIMAREQTLANSVTQAAQLSRDLERARRRLERAEQRQRWPVLGLYWRWRLPARARQLNEQIRALEEYIDDLQSLGPSAPRSPVHGRRLAPEALLPTLEQLLTQLRAQHQQYVAEEREKARSVIPALERFMPSAERSGDPPLDVAGFLAYLHQFEERWHQHLRERILRRYQLIQDWHQELQARTEDLYPLLVQTADVIGATCIGAATARALADVTFDLVIADEAGQISLPDLLVPLVRGKRALLVGDHQQLPPLVDETVRARLKLLRQKERRDEEEDEEAEIASLLTRSMFETLVEHVDGAHFVLLNRQYRMPASIASFVSQQFYQGRLQTASEVQRRPPSADPFFQKPFVFIDTARMEASQRREKGRYSNEAEAQLIAEIASLYTQQGIDWLVIVPYQEQATCIRTRLQQLTADYQLDLQARVATVDSFQGGECQKVLYSFTRSNSRHAIGFLSELRRLNVALTRAQEQLILVGDSTTLSNATRAGQPDEPFQILMKALIQHARQEGEYLSSHECRMRLGRQR